MPPLRTPYTRVHHPVYKRLSDLQAGAPHRPSGGRSLNAKYDQQRLSLPIEYIGRGKATHRSGASTHGRELESLESRAENDSFDDDGTRMSNSALARQNGLQRLDDLLAGRVRPRRAPAERHLQTSLPLHRGLHREAESFASDAYVRPPHQTTSIGEYPSPADLRDDHTRLIQCPPFPNVQFVPDHTSTPVSQIPHHTPSPPFVTESPVPRLRDTNAGNYGGGCDPPLRRGILKNSYLEPFCAPDARRATAAARNGNSVRFRSTPDQQITSSRWPSESDMAVDLEDRFARPNGHLRFHDRFAMPIPDLGSDGLEHLTYGTTLPSITIADRRVPTPLVRAHHDLVHGSPVYSSTPSRVSSPTPARHSMVGSRHGPRHVVQIEPGPPPHAGNDSPVLKRLERSIDPSLTADDADDDMTAVGTDELNLRSIEDELPDYRHHANYPQQVKSESPRDESGTFGPDTAEQGARPLTLTEKAWTFHVPKEVDQQTRRDFKQARGQGRSKMTKSKSTANTQKQSHQVVKTEPADIGESPSSWPASKVDDTLETISVFSEDGRSEAANMEDKDKGDEIRMLSPVHEEEEVYEAPVSSASQSRQRAKEGFFAPGASEVGFRIWRDGS